LVARQPLANGRFRESNMLVGALRPIVTTATINAGGLLTVTGTLLGNDSDDVLIAFFQDGAVARLFDSPATAPDQQTLTVANSTTGVTPGTYLMIVRVNGQQARLSPPVLVS
jgi:hypothetical protein